MGRSDPPRSPTIRLFRFLEPQTDLRPARLFFSALLWSTLGLWVGTKVFPGSGSIVSLFLLTLPLLPTIFALLERNREEVYAPDGSRIKANRDLAGALLILFMAILLAYGAAVLWSGDATTDAAWYAPLLGNFAGQGIETVNFGNAAGLLQHNAIVFLFVFLLALLYREGGLMLVLGWNASRWGAIFAYMALVAGTERVMPVAEYLAKTAIVVLPHLLLEALAYVLAAMSGVFLSRGLARYPLRSAIFADVLVWGVLRIAGVGLVFLIAAALVEAAWATALVGRLF
jgi:hypothetical protein